MSNGSEVTSDSAQFHISPCHAGLHIILALRLSWQHNHACFAGWAPCCLQILEGEKLRANGHERCEDLHTAVVFGRSEVSDYSFTPRIRFKPK